MKREIKDRIRHRLNELGLNKRQASLRMGSEYMLSNILNRNENSEITTKTLKKIASALNVSEHWLLTGDDSKDPPEAPPLDPHALARAMTRTGDIIMKSGMSLPILEEAKMIALFYNEEKGGTPTTTKRIAKNNETSDEVSVSASK